ncbi:MAG: sigma-54 interaction domain-containing protein [Ignavibacteriales bacterium]
MERSGERFARNILEALLHRVDEGIHAVDHNGDTIVYNEAMGRLEGLEPGTVMGRNVLDVFPSLQPETSTLMRALRTGQPIGETTQTYTNDKGQKITTVNLTVPLKRGDRVVGAVEIAKDVTRLRQLSEEIVDLQNVISTRTRPVKKETPPGEGTQPQRKANLTQYTFDDLIGAEISFAAAVATARKAARTLSPVLIYGETGTGKELVAQAIHNESDRSGGPFIGQNCAALPESLLEGMLFGTCKGAFTGAVDRPGLFEQASPGTLLLDEINSMPMQLQAKILRVLEEGSVRRVGAMRETAAAPRIIATMNLNPETAMANGVLRPDLYYRISVVNVHMPPLRERTGDIPLLVERFLDKYNVAFRKRVRGVSPAVMSLFERYRWPGNVRELENAIEAAFNVIGDEEFITPEHLPPGSKTPWSAPGDMGYAGMWRHAGAGDDAGPTGGLPAVLNAMEREMIVRALEASGGTVSRAAARLRINRQLLQYKMKKHGLKRANAPSEGRPRE